MEAPVAKNIRLSEAEKRFVFPNSTYLAGCALV